MFKKLLSNLPFNPSLIHQVSFYAKRIRSEERIRRTGLILFALSFVLQIFMIISPAQPSLAASPNDIIYGGIGTDNPKFGWFGAYNANTDQNGHNDIRQIYDYFHISVTDVQNSTFTSINSSDHSLYSLGRLPHSTLDQPININGTTYYLRPLYSWGNNISYKALVGNRADPPAGQSSYFAVMADCGNIVIKFAPSAKLAIVKHGLNHADNALVQRGELLQYRVFFSNIGAGDAYNVVLRDGIPANTTYVPPVGTGGADEIFDHGSTPVPPFPGQAPAYFIDWKWNVMPAQRENWYVDLNVKVNSNVPDGTKICNGAFVVASNLQPVLSNQVCYTVSVPKTTTPAPVIPIIPSIPVSQPGQPNISKSKLVANLTKGQNDANNKTAAPGDILQYTLLTINSGDAKAPKFSQLTDDVHDILEYAGITEISDGGELKNGVISWKATDIPAKDKLTRTFKVQIKNPLPATPQSKSDPQSYDLKMDNVYGNQTTVNLESPSLPKTVETAQGKLVNTGPGETIAAAFAMTVFISYFFARTRLFAHELEIVKTDYAIQGGN